MFNNVQSTSTLKAWLSMLSSTLFFTVAMNFQSISFEQLMHSSSSLLSLSSRLAYLLRNKARLVSKFVIVDVYKRQVVEDSGPGIDVEYKNSIFKRFVKIDTFSPGTGLGLAVARQIMDIVDGQIFLDTTYTDGARFVVEWPVG